MTTVYILQLFENEYNAKHQIIAVWTEHPQLGHLEEVITEGELSREEKIRLLDNYAVEDKMHNSWSLENVECGVRIQ